MPRVRSQYIAEMRERFEVVDRVKASAEEKASLTKAIAEEESSPEVSPSKENTLRKDEQVVKLTFEDDAVLEKTSKKEDEIEAAAAEDNEADEDDNDVETGIKVLIFSC